MKNYTSHIYISLIQENSTVIEGKVIIIVHKWWSVSITRVEEIHCGNTFLSQISPAPNISVTLQGPLSSLAISESHGIKNSFSHPPSKNK